jgi:hypothetical protein
MLVIFKAIVSKGQKDWRQTTRAIGQVKKRCERESTGNEQREQLVSGDGESVDREILNFVGLMFYTIFQRKSFSMLLRLSFQRAFQQVLGKGDEGKGVRELIK